MPQGPTQVIYGRAMDDLGEILGRAEVGRNLKSKSNWRFRDWGKITILRQPNEAKAVLATKMSKNLYLNLLWHNN
jgi:hypothetical protein